jgi:hypothetical protein
LPDPWLADSVWLLEELAKTRETILRVPLSLNNASDIKSAIDRLFSLEQTLRFLLKLRTEGQWSFAQRGQQSGSPGSTISADDRTTLRLSPWTDRTGKGNATPRPPLRAVEKKVLD